VLAFTFVAAALWMRDLGFTPDRSKGIRAQVRMVLRASIDNGWRNPPVRWLMLAGLFNGGVGMYAFYALQPFLLQLYGDERAFGVAGVIAALVAGTQIAAGLAAPLLRRMASRRTHVLLGTTLVSAVCLLAMGFMSSFPVALAVVVVWSFSFWAASPFRDAYVNALIPSAQRATVLSFDNLMDSAGGALAQPMLGRVADASGYPASYLVCSAIQAVALPFVALARREDAPSDAIAHKAAAR
jgi:predicted MFS family arabinose efflux permease